MAALAENKIIALGRMMFVPKRSLRMEQILVEASGPYELSENENCFIIQNKDCCKSILVTIKIKE